jgi:hypothetical protein
MVLWGRYLRRRHHHLGANRDVFGATEHEKGRGHPAGGVQLHRDESAARIKTQQMYNKGYLSPSECVYAALTMQCPPARRY